MTPDLTTRRVTDVDAWRAAQDAKRDRAHTHAAIERTGFLSQIRVLPVARPGAEVAA